MVSRPKLGSDPSFGSGRDSGCDMREGVGEDSRHGIECVDIQVGSCICLSVCLC